MKKIFKLVAISLFLPFAMGSCIDLEEINVNPNKATTTQPALLLTNISYNAFSETSSNACHATKMLILTSGESTYQVYKWTRGDFDNYNSLRDVTKMMEEANGNDAYEALALFFRAHYFYKLTLNFGDIPYTDALKAESDNIYQPKYDSQENVFEGILTDLSKADNLLENSKNTISGDIIYNGDLTKWRKLINAYRLRVLMTLSKKSVAGSINISQEFANIADNLPIMTSSADNGQLSFLDQQSNRYPYFNDSDFGSGRFMDETFINLLQERQDPRLFAFCTQTPNSEKAGKPIDDFTSYDGGDPSIAYSLVNDKATNGDCSKPDPRYYQNPTNEPMILLGYSEQQLILAEGVVLGWITGNDKEYYESAVKASFAFYQSNASKYSQYLTPQDAEEYLNGNKVKYENSLSKEEKIERISIQKYIPTFLQGSCWLPYYQVLRTGYPELKRAAGVNLPYRWLYPQSEYNNNIENLENALSSQFGGNDRISDKPWWLL